MGIRERNERRMIGRSRRRSGKLENSSPIDLSKKK